jgi:solute:Na+ symporter, SSS family
MADEPLILAVVIVYLLFMCAIGVYLRRRIHGFADFMVAGRSAGLLVVASSFVGSHFGGGMTVGGAELGARSGLSGIWYGLACGFSYLLLLVIVRKVYALKQMTAADVLELVYGTKRVRALFAIVAFVGSLGIIGGQILAGGAMFATFGVSREIGGVITFIIIVVYCAFSGLYGVMLTDTIQVAIGGFGVVLGAVLAVNRIGGLSHLAALPAQKLSLFPADLGTLVWLVVPTTLLGLISQPSYQRVNACRDERTAVRAPLAGAVVVMVLAVFPILTGMCASVLWPDLNPALAVPQLLKEVFPPVVAAVFIAAILAAIMSTADSVLLAGVANAVRDIYQQILRPNASDKELLRISTAATVVIGLGALAVTYMVPRIIDLFLISYAIQVCGGLIPVVGALLWKRGTEQGAWGSFLVGIGFVTLSTLKVIDIPYDYVVGLIPALFVYVSVSLLTGKKKRGRIEGIP